MKARKQEKRLITCQPNLDNYEEMFTAYYNPNNRLFVVKHRKAYDNKYICHVATTYEELEAFMSQLAEDYSK